MLVLASIAGAEAPEFLTRISAEEGQPGSGAGEVDNPRGIAADPDSGHVYVSDFNNARINEYTAWGLFVKSWGWDVAPDNAPGDTSADQGEVCGPGEPEEEPPVGLCQGGALGGGRGQISMPLGLTLDSAGNVYVFELGNLRVQKFSPAGEFLLMFGGGVNRTKVEEGAPTSQQNRCPVAPGDICQAGTPGEDPSYLNGVIGNYIGYSVTADAIVVGDKGRIQIFNLDGTYREEIFFDGPLALFADKSVNALDVDQEGSIFFSLSGEEDVFKLSAAGAPLAPGMPGGSQFEVEVPLAVAVDTDGSLYAVDDPTEEFMERRVVKFDAAGSRLTPTNTEEEAGEFFPYVPFDGPALNGIATNLCVGSEAPGNLYVGAFSFGVEAYVDAYGTGPVGCEPPPAKPPEITAQFATSVGRSEATVKAQINPKFWSDVTYYVEYGTGVCSQRGCPTKLPLLSPILTGKAVNSTLTTAGLVLEGLLAGTTYRYRFVSQSSGGGPVYGTDPDGQGPEEASQQAGLEASFETFASKASESPCPNDAFRVGLSAELPDCRAYEMVSPLEKEGGDVALWVGRNAFAPFLIELHQSDRTGDRFTYTSSMAFGDPQSAPYVSQYLAERDGDGWASEAISPPGTKLPVTATRAFGNHFKIFSDDLCLAWLRHFSVSPLSPGAVEGYPNLYRRQNCADPPSYHALTTRQPPNRDPEEYFELQVLGFSQDGAHTIFLANDKLHPDAPALKETGKLVLYESTPEGLRFVCYLPSGKPNPGACSAGTGAGGIATLSAVHNAISADGSHIFWTAYEGDFGGANDPGAPGQIYVRVEGEETINVSRSKGVDPAWFWTAADDGSKAIFAFDSGVFKDQLYEFDVATKTSRLIAGGVEGPMGASEDASRIYFASNEDLDGAGEGGAGKHNLYLYEADPGGGKGSFTYVMTLTATDIGGSTAAPAPIDEVPAQRSARVSSDGLHATFVSSASPTPTGFDNLDAVSGKPDQEVYLYDAVEDDLDCVSCNATGARPSGQAIEGPIWAAARIQGWEIPGRAPRILSEDGARVFFESHEALVPRDSNATWDVYQWEEPGRGTCTAAADTFSTDSGGCVELISSGQSAAKSTFLDADPDGHSIFFGTQGSLVGGDYGLNDVYVARAGGGFPEPVLGTECEGQACQSPPPPPSTHTPSSEAFHGPGNSARRRCSKGKRRVVRKGKARCLRKKRSTRRNRKHAANRSEVRR